MCLLRCRRCAWSPARRVILELQEWGWGTRGISDYHSEPDPERVRNMRVMEAPQRREVGGVALVRELSQMFEAAPDVPRCGDRTLLLPHTRLKLRSVNKVGSAPSPPLLGAGLKERLSPPLSSLVGAAVGLCLLPPSPVPPHTQCRRIQVPHPRDGSGMTSFANRPGGRGSDAGNRAKKARGWPQEPHSPPSSLARKYPASRPRSGASYGEFLGVPREVGRRV